MNTIFAFALAFFMSLQVPPVELTAIKAFEAYSKKDIKTFASLFTEEAEVTIFPNKPFLKGRAEIQKSYGTFFAQTPDLHAELVSRQVKDNRVIDEMLVTRIKGRKPDKVSVLYEIENGLIVKMCFL